MWLARPYLRNYCARTSFLSSSRVAPRSHSHSNAQRHLSGESARLRKPPEDGLTLKDFLSGSASSRLTNDVVSPPSIPHSPTPIPVSMDAESASPPAKARSYFIETHGCQMNVNDTEIVSSVLKSAGLQPSTTVETANVILINTCSIRESAENKVWQRLKYFRKLKWGRPAEDKPVVGVLGCMAERLKSSLLEEKKMVDLVVGPDAYRNLPQLIKQVEGGETAVNVLLSMDETYADIVPVRHSSNGVSSFVTIMRGCDNMCSFCIVPFTRGRERSRDVQTIVDEVQLLVDQGYKEVVLLGQNVNSYNFIPGEGRAPLSDGREAMSRGFVNISKRRVHDHATKFTELVDCVSAISPELRVRFTSPHPKDFPDDLLYLIRERPNICHQLHLPAQSGSTSVLQRMRRGYTREAYLQLVDHIRSIIPDVAFSTDIIAGFCGETEDEHADTVSLMHQVQYDSAFMFQYSQREGTHAHRRLVDDVALDIKNRRLNEIIDVFQTTASRKNQLEVGGVHLVLIEGKSRRSANDLFGRSDTNKKVVFPNTPIPYLSGEALTRLLRPSSSSSSSPSSSSSAAAAAAASASTAVVGDYVVVRTISATSTSFRGVALAKCSISDYHQCVYSKGLHLSASLSSVHYSSTVLPSSSVVPPLSVCPEVRLQMQL